MGLKSPIFNAPKYVQNSGLWSFSQKVLDVYRIWEKIKIQAFSHFLKKFPMISHQFCLNVLIGDNFRWNLMMCPIGLNSGPKIKVAAEPVRPSGLLFISWCKHQCASSGTQWSLQLKLACFGPVASPQQTSHTMAASALSAFWFATISTTSTDTNRIENIPCEMHSLLFLNSMLFHTFSVA